MADSTAREPKGPEKSKTPEAIAADDAAALTDKEADAVSGGLGDIVITKTTDKTSPP